MTTDTSRFMTALRAFAKEHNLSFLTRAQVNEVAASVGLKTPDWFLTDEQFRATKDQLPPRSGAGRPPIFYKVPPEVGTNEDTPESNSRALVAQAPPMEIRVQLDQTNMNIQQEASRTLGLDVLIGSTESIPFVPKVNPDYEVWGIFSQMCTIVESGHFLPVMITGPSGNGKTDMIEQVCATLYREYVRINITHQTDEDDLLGGFRLINGDTKFVLGPIPLAMMRGAVVNLDEIDLGGASMMCLQSVLEGKPLYLKKIGRYIHPAPGFTVVATANTKGRGDDGRYAHTMFMNDAMLERFAVMFEMKWPDAATEQRILHNILRRLGKPDFELAKHLVEFAATTRSNYEQQLSNAQEQIATRRLIHMVRTYCALGDLNTAMDVTLARFDPQTTIGFRNLWTAIRESATATPSPSGARV